MMLDVHLVANDAPLSQLSAVLSGFVPEALSFGAIFTFYKDAGIILAGIATIQNVHGGFKVYKEINETTNYSRLEIIFAFTLMVMLAQSQSSLVTLCYRDILKLFPFAAGGILYIYIIFQDVALQSNLRKLGASTGCCWSFFA